MTSNPSAEQIEADITRTREELAHTVDELTARLDVKARVQERVQQTSPTTLGIAAAVAVLVVAVVIWRRRR
jgi:uncharacterized protein (TIGR03382 family)